MFYLLNSELSASLNEYSFPLKVIDKAQELNLSPGQILFICQADWKKEFLLNPQEVKTATNCLESQQQSLNELLQPYLSCSFVKILIVLLVVNMNCYWVLMFVCFQSEFEYIVIQGNSCLLNIRC